MQPSEKQGIEGAAVPISRTTDSFSLPWFPYTPIYAVPPWPQCMRRVLDHGYNFTTACPAAYQVAAEKVQELEIRFNTPIASVVTWTYIILGTAALAVLSADLGHNESRKQRRQRQLREELSDPLLRAILKMRAAQQLDEEGVGDLMSNLDAEVERWQAEDVASDATWKRQEARLLAWKNRVSYSWGLRLFLCFCFLFSSLLLMVDRPHAMTVVDGMMVATLVFFLTYMLLPASPQRRKKMMDAAKSRFGRVV